jgi:DNA-binding MarR family transcriptional regulator
MCDFDSPYMRIAWLLRDIQHRHMMHLHGEIEKTGLHWGQPRILHMVSVMDGATQKEIAEKLMVSPASLAMSIKRMQRAGLIEKAEDEKDLRVNLIRLTEKGKRIEEGCFLNLKETDNRMLEGFNSEEIAQLSGFLERVIRNFDKIDQTEETKNDR